MVRETDGLTLSSISEGRVAPSSVGQGSSLWVESPTLTDVPSGQVLLRADSIINRYYRYERLLVGPEIL